MPTHAHSLESTASLMQGSMEMTQVSATHASTEHKAHK